MLDYNVYNESEQLRMWQDARIDRVSMISSALRIGVEPFHLAEYYNLSLEKVYEIEKHHVSSVPNRRVPTEEELCRMKQETKNNMIAHICEELSNGNAPAFLSILYDMPMEEILALQESMEKSGAANSIKKRTLVEAIRMREIANNQWNAMIDAAERRNMGQSPTEIAQGMKQDRVDPVFIAKYSGLTLEEVAAL